MLTGIIYSKNLDLMVSAKNLIDEKVNLLRAKGLPARPDRNPIYDGYGTPWRRELTLQRFPMSAVLVPFIPKVDDNDEVETLLVSTTITVLKNRDLRFLIYPKARSAHFDVVTADNCNAFIGEARASDSTEIQRMALGAQLTALESVTTGYELMINLCYQGEKLLVQKVYVHLIDAIPAQAVGLRLSINSYIIPFYVIFTTTNAKRLFTERKAKHNDNNLTKEESIFEKVLTYIKNERIKRTNKARRR